jgi:hypothetical protein
VQLSLELFQAITRRSSGKTRLHEKRRGDRIPLAAQATILPLPKGKAGSPLTVDVLNISFKSIGIISADWLGKGDQFLLRMPRPNQKPVWVQCLVTRSQLGGKKGFLIGARFVRYVDLAQRQPSSSIEPASLPENGDAETIRRIRRAILS